jgi:hypothetical protein
MKSEFEFVQAVVFLFARLLFPLFMWSAAQAGTGADGQGEYLPLNILWRVQTSSYDLMTSADVTEKRKFTDFGAYSYVPAAQPLTGPTSTFWRMYANVGFVDHMDSTVRGLDGYTKWRLDIDAGRRNQPVPVC